MEEPIVFLDANVLFSAALGGEVFNAIWAVVAGAWVLLTRDTRHFGGLMGEGAPSLREHSLPLRVMTPADFIRNFRP